MGDVVTKSTDQVLRAADKRANRNPASPLPPPQPVYILRGHASPIHSVQFFRQNTRLLSADADGWVVIWDVTTKRPLAVWKAHDSALLGTAPWGEHRIVTHGRDNKIHVWDLDPKNVPSKLSVVLPVEDAVSHRPQPWLLHSLDVNSLNFCGFSMCEDARDGPSVTLSESPRPVLIAVPSSLDSDGIDIFHLPSEARIHTIPSDKAIKTGMVMALRLFHHRTSGYLMVAAGYESGHTSLFQLCTQKWTRIYTSQPHSQPVLSLALSPSQEYYLTSAADSLIAKHPIPFSPLPSPIAADPSPPLKTARTHHAAQEGLAIRSDGKIFATGGWDARVRVYSCNGSMRELAVLKWHRDGVFRIAFGAVDDDGEAADEAADEVQVGTVLTTEQRGREERAKTGHWLAAGGKDGKVSLWEIY